MKKIFVPFLYLGLCGLFAFTACQSPKGEQEVEIKQVTNEKALSAPFIHTAYFWLKEGVTEEEKAAFIKDSKALANIETVLAFYDGQPAITNRDVVENTYDYAIVFHFADLEAQEFYQEAPLHKSLIEKHEHLWEKVMVTDITP